MASWRATGTSSQEVQQPPAMGQAHDFSFVHVDSSSGRRPPPSIEVASAEALQMLQRQYYGATTTAATQGTAGRDVHCSCDVEGGVSLPPSHRGPFVWLAVSADDATSLVVKQSISFALLAPVIILAPWLNRVLSTIIRDLVGLAEANEVAVAVTHEAVLRLGGFLAVGGFFVTLFKLLLTAPCIGYGGTLMDLILPTRPATIRIVADTVSATTVGERGGVGAPAALSGAKQNHSVGTSGGIACAGGSVSSRNVNLLPEPLPNS